MQTLQKIGFSLLAAVTALEQSFAATTSSAGLTIDESKINNNVKGTTNDLPTAVQNIISKAMVFLGALLVVYALYGGFLILTAAGEEDKVKKGKTILVHAATGLVVIILAGSIVSWLIGIITGV